MRTSIDVEKKLRDLKPLLMDKFSVNRIGYFGSYANHEHTENSDLDILVEFSKPVGWEFFTLEKFLEEAIGVKVDLVTPKALKEQLKEKIINQVKYL